MDVRQYFEPVDFSRFNNEQKNKWKFALGKVIEKYTTSLSIAKIRKTEIAIIGVPCNNGKWEESSLNIPDKIRGELYNLALIDSNVNIVDFGNIRESKSQRGTILALRDVVEYFNDLDIVTIVLGGSQDLSVGIVEANKANSFFSFTSVDSVLDIKLSRETTNSENFLSKVFQIKPDIFQFNLLAYQRHLVSNTVLIKTKGVNQHVRLGIITEDILKAEPVLRNSDFVSFDVGSIKSQEFGGSRNNRPNGLNSQEACQIAKYAGFSERLKTFGLFEFGQEMLELELSQKLSAEIIWYFIEGYIYRDKNLKDLNKNKTIFKVEVKGLESPIVFYNCESTKRWWFEINIENKKKMLLACSKEDYIKASENEIPELWLNYIQKTDEFLK